MSLFLFEFDLYIFLRVKVAPGGGTTINLPIVPVDLGNIDIEVTAVSSIAGDAVRRQLLVEVGNAGFNQASIIHKLQLQIE